MDDAASGDTSRSVDAFGAVSADHDDAVNAIEHAFHGRKKKTAWAAGKKAAGEEKIRREP